MVRRRQGGSIMTVCRVDGRRILSVRDCEMALNHSKEGHEDEHAGCYSRDLRRGGGMTSRDDSENLEETAESLRLELAASRLQVTTLECSLHSAEEALRETKAALEFSLTSGRIGDWDLDLITD